MKKEKIHLTKAELEIMQVLWRLGPSTVRTVNNEILKNRHVGYTTTLKIIQQLTEKLYLNKDTSQSAHVFSAKIKKKQIQKSLLGDFVERAYSGNTSSMILQALGNHKISKDEIKDIESFLKKMKKNNK